MAQRSLILDAGALIAWSRHDRRVRAYVTVARNEGIAIVIPPIVVTQTVRGGAGDTMINRLLKVAFIPFVGERLARSAGQVLAASGLSDAAEAQIVAEALRSSPATILTSDPADLLRLAQDLSGVQIIVL